MVNTPTPGSTPEETILSTLKSGRRVIHVDTLMLYGVPKQTNAMCWTIQNYKLIFKLIWKMISLKLPKFKLEMSFLTLDKNQENIITLTNNTQLLQILVIKHGPFLNLINRTKLPGTQKPSNKTEVSVVPKWPTDILNQSTEVTVKPLTLSQTKECQDMLVLLNFTVLLRRIPRLKWNMIIFGSKNLLFHHITKWITPGPRMNSIRKMRSSGTNKPNLKLDNLTILTQLMETALQFMVEMENQHTLSQTKECPVMSVHE